MICDVHFGDTRYDLTPAMEKWLPNDHTEEQTHDNKKLLLLLPSCFLSQSHLTPIFPPPNSPKRPNNPHNPLPNRSNRRYLNLNRRYNKAFLPPPNRPHNRVRVNAVQIPPHSVHIEPGRMRAGVRVLRDWTTRVWKTAGGGGDC